MSNTTVLNDSNSLIEIKLKNTTEGSLAQRSRPQCLASQLS
jgi:hypothetical protein